MYRYWHNRQSIELCIHQLILKYVFPIITINQIRIYKEENISVLPIEVFYEIFIRIVLFNVIIDNLVSYFSSDFSVFEIAYEVVVWKTLNHVSFHQTFY